MSLSLLALAILLPRLAPDVAVICPAVFREALEPWLEYRAQQGRQIALVSNLGTAEEIRREIRRLSEGGRLRFVVLVGDADPAMDDDPDIRARCVPVHRAKAEVTVLWGSPPHIATDNWYADLDDDEVPDVAVGRFTPDNPQELAVIVSKILAYERSTDFGTWRRRLNFVAGIGGFSPVTDVVLESAARHLLTRNIPAEYAVHMTYANWRSPYCPDPRLFHRTTVERLNEGCQFWVYLGHGYHLGLDRVWVPGARYPILANADVDKLHCEHGLPIALFLSCYTGAFDASDDCLAEEMLRTPGAPVAVVAGSRMTMPYAMAVMGTELMDQFFHSRCETLGEGLLHAKQHLLKPPAKTNPDRAMLDTLASFMSPTPSKLAAERAEHVLLFNLIGDPLLRMRPSRQVVLETAAKTVAGTRLEVSGRCPLSGRATIELVVQRDRLAVDPPPRNAYPRASERLAEFQEVYRRANDSRLATVDLQIEEGPFRTELLVPEGTEGACHVRVFVQGTDDFAIGAADVRILAADAKIGE